jgi:hypothetical protein
MKNLHGIPHGMMMGIIGNFSRTTFEGWDDIMCNGNLSLH